MSNVKLTQKFKLFKLRKRKKELLDATIARFKECVNEWLKAIDQLEEYPNRKNVHEFAYRNVRKKFEDLHSNVVQEAMNRAIEIYRAWLRNPNKGDKPCFKADIISFKSVDIKIEGHFISVPLLNNERVWLPMHVPSKFKQLLKQKIGRVQISRLRDEYYVFISFEVPEPEPYKPRGWFGVDIGLRHIVVVSDAEGKINKFYNSAIDWKKALEYRKADMQRAKDKRYKKGAWRVLRRLSGKIKNLQSYINHCIAKELVLMAKERRCGIAIENLKGLRKGKVGKRHRKRLHKWAYRDLIDKIVYKAKLHGVPVVFVNPKGTSRTCSRCGAKGIIKGRTFVCKKCGLKLDRDLNASRNIAKRAFLSAFQASSPQGV
jgi:putative transposase